MKLIIRDTMKEASVWAARYIAAKINEKAARTSEPFVIGLCTGSTPIETYNELGMAEYQAIEVFLKLY